MNRRNFLSYIGKLSLVLGLGVLTQHMEACNRANDKYAGKEVEDFGNGHKMIFDPVKRTIEYEGDVTAAEELEAIGKHPHWE